jgi:formylglycine-generating enzyme required for sulfatase activity
VLFETLLAQLLTTGSPAPAAPPPASVCPDDMRLVEGNHYEYVQRLCTRFRIGHCFDFFPGFLAFEGQETPIRVCMDQYEWPNQAGVTPKVMVRFGDAQARCAAAGKRLCTEFEWEMACEGPEIRPWPYGYQQDPNACNTNKDYVGVDEAKLASENEDVRNIETWRLWQGAKSGAFPACVSSYGVADLTGNVEEWVTTSRAEWRFPSSLKGGFWAKRWAGCRGTNDSHGPMFRFYEVGFRCCKDPEP